VDSSIIFWGLNIQWDMCVFWTNYKQLMNFPRIWPYPKRGIPFPERWWKHGRILHMAVPYWMIKKWKTWEHIFLLVEVQRICFFFLWNYGEWVMVGKYEGLRVYQVFLEEWQLQGASWTAPCCNPSLWQSKVLISKIDHLHCLPYISLALNQDSPMFE
jgi:hypothetical protein